MAQYVTYVGVGLVAGFASALLGIGGGVIMVPMLILLFTLPAKAATATSLAYMAPVAVYGALRQWNMGQDIRWTLVMLAIPAGVIGAELGSRAKVHVSNGWLQVIFGLLMIVAGVKLGHQGWMATKQERVAADQRPAAAAQPDAQDENGTQPPVD